MSRSPPTAVFDAPLSEGRRSPEVWLSVGTLLPRVVAKDGSGVFLCVSHAPPTTRLTSSISTTCPRQTYFCTVRILMRVGPVPPQLGTTICESLTKALTKSHCHLASRHLDAIPTSRQPSEYVVDGLFCLLTQQYSTPVHRCQTPAPPLTVTPRPTMTSGK